MTPRSEAPTMRGMKIVPFRLLILAFSALLLAACGQGEAAPTPTSAVLQPTPAMTTLMGRGELTAETDSYRITLVVGPVVREGMMQRMSGIMSLMDRGQPVNRHIEIHIYDKSRGVVVKDPAPTVGIIDKSTRISRTLAIEGDASQARAYVAACTLSEHRPADRHFGDNLYLVDSTYTFTVDVGAESAVFENILLKSAG